MIPWRSISGFFGFADIRGDLIMEPKYTHARPDVDGYAIAAIAPHKYGIINARGETVLPFNYAFIETVETDGAPIAITKKEYSAWWRFWEWKLLPNWNILSRGVPPPYLVTYVPRAVWKVHSLPQTKTRFKMNSKDNVGPWGRMYWKKSWYPHRKVPKDINVQTWGDGFIQIQDKLFRRSKKDRLQLTNDAIFGRLDDGSFLKDDEGTFRRVDPQGKPLDEITYSKRESITFKNASGGSLTLPKYWEGWTHEANIPASVFQSNKGRYYLFPDFSKPLPQTISAYHTDDKTVISAKDIIKATWRLASIAQSPWFLVLSGFSKGEDIDEKGFYTLLINSEGNWQPTFNARKGMQTLLTDGRLLFTRTKPKGVLYPDASFQTFPMDSIRVASFSKNLYIGQDQESQQQGVYDAVKKQWNVKLDDFSIGYEIIPGIATYSKKGAHPVGAAGITGLLNIETGEKITPPVYDKINADARVIKTEEDHKIEYYINPATGMEYREKVQEQPR